ncbi:MAG: Vitamin B12 dependent methionine synthase activation subunit [Ruminococcaceae bacterium]|nr:Vitamin B12 dependent methionine synthase activation subunit [Oscillospiraceae bacterium]
MALSLVKSYVLPSINRREVLRYAGIRSSSGESAELISRLDEAIALIGDVLNPRVCFCELDIRDCDFGFSLDIKKNLRDSHSVIFFASTLGIELDRLIFKYSVLSPVTALLLEALGNERIEALCDLFCEDMRQTKLKMGETLRPRFSAGYGDLPLEYQRRIFDLLDPPTHIGLTLNDSYLMSPSKSVTALIGVEKIKEV